MGDEPNLIAKFSKNNQNFWKNGFKVFFEAPKSISGVIFTLNPRRPNEVVVEFKFKITQLYEARYQNVNFLNSRVLGPFHRKNK